MSKFKVGDKVLATRNDDWGLSKGTPYEVMSTDGGSVFLLETAHWHSASDVEPIVVSDPMSKHFQFESVNSLTKREQIAAMAMQGIIIRNGSAPYSTAKEAVSFAVALLEELNK